MVNYRMSIVFQVLFVMCVLLSDGVSSDDRKLFRNMKSSSCPNGVVYREGCNLCFCISLFDGSDAVKCKTRFSARACRSLIKTSHCNPEDLLYEYSRECEGECTCNKWKNLTTCENLPCDDTLLWFHGYYNESDKGHPVRKGDTDNEIEPSVGDDDPEDNTETEVHTIQGHKGRKPKVLEDDEKKANAEDPNKRARRFGSRGGNDGSNYHDVESEPNEDTSNRRKHQGRRFRRDVNNEIAAKSRRKSSHKKKKTHCGDEESTTIMTTELETTTHKSNHTKKKCSRHHKSTTPMTTELDTTTSEAPHTNHTKKKCSRHHKSTTSLTTELETTSMTTELELTTSEAPHTNHTKKKCSRHHKSTTSMTTELEPTSSEAPNTKKKKCKHHKKSTEEATTQPPETKAR